MKIKINDSVFEILTSDKQDHFFVIGEKNVYIIDSQTYEIINKIRFSDAENLIETNEGIFINNSCGKVKLFDLEGNSWENIKLNILRNTAIKKFKIVVSHQNEAYCLLSYFYDYDKEEENKFCPFLLAKYIKELNSFKIIKNFDVKESCNMLPLSIMKTKDNDVIITKYNQLEEQVNIYNINDNDLALIGKVDGVSNLEYVPELNIFYSRVYKIYNATYFSFCDARFKKIGEVALENPKFDCWTYRCAYEHYLIFTCRTEMIRVDIKDFSLGKLSCRHFSSVLNDNCSEFKWINIIGENILFTILYDYKLYKIPISNIDNYISCKLPL